MKLSVVISVYNEEKLIEACLESLLAQTRRADEIILVDNNCTDQTVALARKYPVRIVKEKKQGIWAARATGYDAAKGDIIVCTDADARFPASWLELIEKQFHESSVIAVTGPGVFYDGNRLTNTLANIFYMKLYFLLVGLALSTRPLFGSNFAMRKEGWLAVRDHVHSSTEEVFDDMDLSYHLITHGKLHFDRRLANQISIRPLKSVSGMGRRYRKGLRSIMIHWPTQSPVHLYAKRIWRAV